MTEPIAPALTPEEWADPPDVYPLCVEWDGHEHAIGALALHGQPFGFTQEDVAQLHHLRTWLLDGPVGRWEAHKGSVLASLADRIAALLPPRET